MIGAINCHSYQTPEYKNPRGAVETSNKVEIMETGLGFLPRILIP